MSLSLVWGPFFQQTSTTTTLWLRPREFSNTLVIIKIKKVRCNPALRRNRGKVAYFWNAMSVMSVDFRDVDAYVIHDPRSWSHPHIIIIIIVITIIFIIIIIIVIIIIIPYEDKLMLLSDSAFLPYGVENLLIPYEDKLVLFIIQHICQRGRRIFDPSWRSVDVITPFNIFVKGVADLWSRLKIKHLGSWYYPIPQELTLMMAKKMKMKMMMIMIMMMMTMMTMMMMRMRMRLWSWSWSWS